MDRKCKRIIDGKTYNTETATKLGGWMDDEYGFEQGEYLYQSRLGAFFLYCFSDDGPEGPEQEIKPCAPDQAQRFLEQHESYSVDLIESLFGEAPEVGSGEIKFTLRLPESLRDRLAALAKENNQSLNAWMVRCLERGSEVVADIEVPVTMALLQMGGKCPNCGELQCIMYARKLSSLQASNCVVECCNCRKRMRLSDWMGGGKPETKISN